MKPLVVQVDRGRNFERDSAKNLLRSEVGNAPAGRVEAAELAFHSCSSVVLSGELILIAGQ